MNASIVGKAVYTSCQPGGYSVSSKNFATRIRISGVGGRARTLGFASKLADACPSCGRPQKVKPSIFYYVFTGTMSFVLTGIFLLAALVLLLENYFPDFYERAVVKGIIMRFSETDNQAGGAIPLQKTAAPRDRSAPASATPSEEETAAFERMLVEANGGDPAAQRFLTSIPARPP